MAERGFIKLHRQIKEHDFYKEPRQFSKFEAWLYILLNAKYEEEIEKHYGIEITIPVGAFTTSYSKLAKTWGWNKKAVKNFIDYLVQQNMIEIHGTKVNPKPGTKIGTTISVVNWALYQSDRTKTGTKMGTKTGTRNRVPSIIKEEKNILSLSEFVSMTKEEIQKLVDEFGLEATKAMVGILNNYKGSSGKKYKSDYMAIRSWVVKRYQEDKKKGLLFDDGDLLDPPH